MVFIERKPKMRVIFFFLYIKLEYSLPQNRF
jgi:hypothetical protein